MASWRDDKILELANQLSYSNADKRHEQLDAAIALAGAVDAGKAYPWDFVHFRITGFQPVTHTDHVVAGKVLRADLSTLIEFLSDTLSIKVEKAVGADSDDSVLTMEEVSKKFTVSSKTVQRWRKQGLIALRYVYPDGRRRLGFLDSGIRRFADVNKDQVERSANFKQLTDEEKARIVEMARELAGQGLTSVKEISAQIGEKLGRSPDTVRYTLRRYEHEHPESPIFVGANETLASTDRAAIIHSHASGMSVESIAERFRRTQASIAKILEQDRAAKLKNTVIEFIANPLFDHPDADQIILTLLPAEALAKAQSTVAAGVNPAAADVYMARTPASLPAFLDDIFRQPVMPHELETDAFRRMNYLRSKAAKRQAVINAEWPSAENLGAIEALLSQANDIKNVLVQGNLRVAVHVARKHQRPERPLIELFSDAAVWLMRAVDTFDFSRPTRFTTYAGYSIMKNFARHRAEALTHRDARLLTGHDETLQAAAAPDGAGPGEALDAKTLHTDLLAVLHELPARERELLTHHYGLDEQQQPLSLSEIATKMAITKARVQQLEVRALRKLRVLLETRRENLHKATMKG